ncbi:MAG: RuvA C-terminal domain-containing protein [Pseudomonadota bacterium]
MGYKPQEASQMVRVIDSTNMSSEDIIRSALQTRVQ